MNRKQILVTGASRGIGKACAIHFAKEGWHVFLNCRKSISELQVLLIYHKGNLRFLRNPPRRCRCSIRSRTYL